jgi:hypothetical protein
MDFLYSTTGGTPRTIISLRSYIQNQIEMTKRNNQFLIIERSIVNNWMNQKYVRFLAEETQKNIDRLKTDPQKIKEWMEFLSAYATTTYDSGLVPQNKSVGTSLPLSSSFTFTFTHDQKINENTLVHNNEMIYCCSLFLFDQLIFYWIFEVMFGILVFCTELRTVSGKQFQFQLIWFS